MKFLVTLLLAEAMLCGCAPKLRIETDWESYETTVPVRQHLAVAADAATVWTAVNGIVHELAFRTIASDAGSGLLMCSKPQEPWENTTLEMSVLLQAREAGITDVHVHSMVLGVPVQRGMELQVYPSSGESARLFLERVADSLGEYREPLQVAAVMPAVPAVNTDVVLPPAVTGSKLPPGEAGFLDAREIGELFRGRIVQGYHHKKDYHFVRRYYADGRMSSDSDAHGERNGRWEAAAGGLCEKWEGKGNKCRRLWRGDDTVVRYDRKGRPIATYRSFQTLTTD
jgi:hypothetical protein